MSQSGYTWHILKCKYKYKQMNMRIDFRSYIRINLRNRGSKNDLELNSDFRDQEPQFGTQNTLF